MFYCDNMSLQQLYNSDKFVAYNDDISRRYKSSSLNQLETSFPSSSSSLPQLILHHLHRSSPPNQPPSPLNSVILNPFLYFVMLDRFVQNFRQLCEIYCLFCNVFELLKFKQFCLEFQIVLCKYFGYILVIFWSGVLQRIIEIMLE